MARVLPVGHMEPVMMRGGTMQDLYRTTDEEAAAIRAANIARLREAGSVELIAQLYPEAVCPICGDDRMQYVNPANGGISIRATCGREACRRAAIGAGMVRAHSVNGNRFRTGQQSEETREKKRRNWRNQHSAAPRCRHLLPLVQDPFAPWGTLASATPSTASPIGTGNS